MITVNGICLREMIHSCKINIHSALSNEVIILKKLAISTFFVDVGSISA